MEPQQTHTQIHNTDAYTTNKQQKPHILKEKKLIKKNCL